MKYLYNELLSKYTTIKIGGTAKEMVIPESKEELCDYVIKHKPQYFIGGGSNLLIAEREFDCIVNLRSFDNTIKIYPDGVFKVGASVRLQKMINEINNAGYGGIEYLFSVPGLVGGAVAMNAGRGKKYNESISDYILSVEVLRNDEIMILSKDECQFEYRNSIFKNGKDIILSCTFKFPEVTQEESTKRKQDRLKLCQQTQDTSKPNFGSVFSLHNSKIMKYVQKHETGGKVHFSSKTNNWIINEGGSFEDAIKAIEEVERMHKLLLQKCKREVIVWK